MKCFDYLIDYYYFILKHDIMWNNSKIKLTTQIYYVHCVSVYAYTGDLQYEFYYQ